MIEFHGKLVLLDIEGTVSPLAFVHEVMFPYARTRLVSHLAAHWNEPAVQAAVEQMASDAGHASFAQWCSAALQPDAFAADEARKLMDADVKATGLKMLQGLIWEQGFRDGALRSTLFDDVPAALQAWHAAGIDMRIYSSGSVHAQKLFFAHTEAGDLTPLFSGYYDTTIGSKREAESYRRIATECQPPAADILFISDVVAELDAARSAGMDTRLAIRPGNVPPPAHDHATVHSFADLSLS
jgi:enolase-phosphatase E1